MEDFIRVYDDALPKQLCDDVLDKFRHSQHIKPGSTGGGVDLEKKHSFDLTITDHDDWQTINERVIDITLRYVIDYWNELYFGLIGAFGLQVMDPTTNQPITLNQENYQKNGAPMADQLVRSLYRPGSINVQQYPKEKGGYPHWHSEIFPKDQSCEQLHRVLLWMFYLNDVTEGGETEFFYQKRAIEPKAGRMVIAPGGFTHTHRGLIPKSNDKYILTSWILFNRAESIYGGPPA